MKKPKVSIIIPFNKDRGFLNEALQSVENQTYSNVELIISQSHKSMSHNFNNGIEKSTGDFIKYLCDDDMLPKDSIEKSVKAFTPATDVIHGNAIVFKEIVSKGIIYRPLKKYLNIGNMIVNNYVHGGTLMYRKEVFEKMGLFNESLWTAEEYEFNLRCLYNHLKFRYVDETLAYYRRHSGQKSIGIVTKEYQNLRKNQIEIIRSWYR
jgi:glycosyltransferase involved in cell wall biosynthesis